MEFLKVVEDINERTFALNHLFEFTFKLCLLLSFVTKNPDIPAELQQLLFKIPDYGTHSPFEHNYIIITEGRAAAHRRDCNSSSGFSDQRFRREFSRTPASIPEVIPWLAFFRFVRFDMSKHSLPGIEQLQRVLKREVAEVQGKFRTGMKRQKPAQQGLGT